MAAPLARLAIAVLAAAALSACTSDADSVPAKESTPPDRSLRGTTWVVTALLDQDVDVPAEVLDAANPTLLIAEDGGVSGSAGCNQLVGTAAVQDKPHGGSSITFQVATTKMMCEPAVMEVERGVLEVLDGNVGATIEGDTLTLRDDDGRGLTLAAR
ncbi:META domain-containing protein [Nocardia farcinica]|uniref:DUF306 domain-containing protein n=2 Tax=Nocardia farcinica TaxID=37329 RepID=Q5YTQ7_NOCFA|nr:META domain-containing protein [Nocardia farcinica]AXK89028.1 META domain-containing protein [Nocardia farcinica]MBF6068659.1 META domain-containing protein [Nocardia farcinica]MBF6142140.1 META domain-containing protein [Nocardia farcinica]MBF6229799.1 META domain-containing protein [Nocardia farcinica]MBF6250388.1 META domain-containing protein [Nocardia farcinica]